MIKLFRLIRHCVPIANGKSEAIFIIEVKNKQITTSLQKNGAPHND